MYWTASRMSGLRLGPEVVFPRPPMFNPREKFKPTIFKMNIKLK